MPLTRSHYPSPGRAIPAIIYTFLILTLLGTTVWGLTSAPQQRFDPTGEYTFTGRLPAAMEDFYSINLILNQRTRRLSGSLSTRGQHPKRRFTAIQWHADDSLSFHTEDIADINYSFEGRLFTMKVPEAEGGSEEPVLVGLLTKFKHRQQVAQIRGRFKFGEFAD